MVAKPSREIELRFQLRFKLIDLAASAFSLLIPWGALIVIAYYLSGSINVLAGKYTFADIGFRVLSDIRVSDGVAYLLGGGGVAYGLNERRLRRKTIERLSGRIQELEKRLDPRRSSSKLTRRGTTRPEDRT